jgi:hypothetical protein
MYFANAYTLADEDLIKKVLLKGWLYLKIRILLIDFKVARQIEFVQSKINIKYYCQ